MRHLQRETRKQRGVIVSEASPTPSASAAARRQLTITGEARTTFETCERFVAAVEAMLGA